jgi:hypothetical protein
MPRERHGQHGTRAYVAWKNMKARCTNPKNIGYHRYGGRGISFHPSFATFAGFWEHLGPCPPGLELDRIDNNGNYEPGNVRWATRDEQIRNRSVSRFIEHGGKVLTIAEWAKAIGLSTITLWARINHYGWPPEKALSAPKMTARESSELGWRARWRTVETQ